MAKVPIKKQKNTKSPRASKIKKQPTTSKKIRNEVEKLHDWRSNKDYTGISKTFDFSSFISALGFVARVAVHSEVLDHHPDIELSYGKVKVKITTHKTKTLTEKDIKLAKRIDSIGKG